MFSIIIPAYNYGRFLARAIDSALAQDGNDFEVLVIDDGSTDNTRAVVDKYRDRISYHHQENRGQSAARNWGIELAQGDYFIFLDADDRMLPGALKHYRQAFAEDPSLGMVIAQHISVAVDGTRAHGRPRPTLGSPLENFRDFVTRKFGICNGAAAVHRKVFKHIHYPEDIRNGEDLAVFAATLENFPCRAIEDVVLEVRAHDGQRVRRDINAIRSTAAQVIDALFRPDWLSPEAMKLRSLFAARKYLSMSRSFYRSGNYDECREYYRKAIAQQWTILFHKQGAFRYLKSFFGPREWSDSARA